MLLDCFANRLRYRDVVSSSYSGEFYRQILRKTQAHYLACHRWGAMLVQIEPNALFCLQTNTDITLPADLRYVGAHMPYRLKFRNLLLIAEVVLGIPAEELERTVCIFRAEASLAAPFARVGGVDLHPDPVERAAICAIRLVRSRPFRRGNREIGHMCLLEMLTRSGYLWLPQADDETEIPAKFKGLEAGTVSEKEFLRWVRSRVKRATGLEDEPRA